MCVKSIAKQQKKKKKKAEETFLLSAEERQQQQTRFSPNKMQMRFLRPRTGSAKRKLEVNAEREREMGERERKAGRRQADKEPKGVQSVLTTAAAATTEITPRLWSNIGQKRN